MKISIRFALGAWILFMVASAQAGYLTTGLEEQMSSLKGDDVIQVLVIMSDLPDIKTLDEDLHFRKASLAVRHQTVVGTLQESAKRSQTGLLAELENNKASGDILGFTSHWIVNSVVVKGTVDSIRQLADRADIERIEADLVIELIKPVPSEKELLSPMSTRGIGIAPGVVAVGARRVWNELGIDGTGVIVGALDTGVAGNHPALQAKWRGNTAPVSECWLDAANLGHATPRDNHGHGSHTMGTILGQAPGDTIGVAPGAQWIASNIIFSGTGVSFDNGVIASLEFMTDPDGDPLTTDDMPVVVNNSWGVNEAFTGYFDCDSRWWDVIDNCEAAGVVTVWSAGNEGSGARTIRSPADRTATIGNCFSVGATSAFSPFGVSYFSSRGPSGCGGAFAIKPEVCAPGSNIYSVNSAGGYQYMSGTSMSCPHIAGIIALMRAANPDVDVTTVKQILMDTATDLGSPGNDNNYGYGFVDAFAAVLEVMDNIGTLEGTVTDQATGLPVENAIVQLDGGHSSARTDSDGFYRIIMPAGDAQFTVESFAFEDGTINVTIPVDATVVADVALNRLPVGIVSGTVFNSYNNPVAGAFITALDTPVAQVVSGADGSYSISLPARPGHLYNLQAKAAGMGGQVHELEIPGDITLDFHLPAWFGENFESGDFSMNEWTMDGNSPWIISSEFHEGQYSARSGNINDQQTSTMSVSMTVSVASDISFWFKVSSEAEYDYLRFLVDGVQLAEWAGEIPWTEYQTPISVGAHTFSWTYFKDEAVSNGSDAAWIDYIEFPIAAQPNIEVDVTEFVEHMASGDSRSVYPLTISNTGGGPLTWVIALDEADMEVKASQEQQRQTLTKRSVSWVSATPLNGQTDPGESSVVNVEFLEAVIQGMDPGTYTAALSIDSNDPDTPNLSLPVTLIIDSVTGVDGALPQTVKLHGAVPNPFNPATNIKFSIPQRAAVRLNLYDVSGRLVRSILDANLPAGHHESHWNGKDDAGRSVASGTYFARLTVDGITSVKAMILVR